MYARTGQRSVYSKEDLITALSNVIALEYVNTLFHLLLLSSFPVLFMITFHVFVALVLCVLQSVSVCPPPIVVLVCSPSYTLSMTLSLFAGIADVRPTHEAKREREEGLYVRKEEHTLSKRADKVEPLIWTNQCLRSC